MVLPSDGETSISLWDAQDPQALHEWLNDNLGGDCTTVLHEVCTCAVLVQCRLSPPSWTYVSLQHAPARPCVLPLIRCKKTSHMACPWTWHACGRQTG